MKILRSFGLSLTAAVVLTLGCADVPGPMGPEIVDPDAELLGGLTRTLTRTLTATVEGTTRTVQDLLQPVRTVRRDRPVGGPEVCDVGVIGPRGGRLECREAGLRLDFPAGAVSEPTEISIRIPDRNLVGYEFHPHGLRFDRKVRMRQSLRGTDVYGEWRLLPRLVGAYVEEVGPRPNALEILPALLGGLLDRSTEVTIEIEHFSGYVCALD